MKHMTRLSLTAACFGMLLMILDSKTAVSAAREGLELCIRTVIPSLFPFFVISSWMTPLLLGCRNPLLRPLGRITGIPAGAESLLLVGFLGGYPTGAACVAEAFRSGRLPRQDAQRMMVFCSNAGPSFLFGILGSLFPRPWMIWLLWGIQIASALICGILLPGGRSRHCRMTDETHTSLPAALTLALRSMALVCGWVILFRVILGFGDRWLFWLLPPEWTVLLSGILELTNGCCSLPGICGVGNRFLMASLLLSFGGLCVAMQTASVTENLSFRLYLPGKLLQCAVSLILSLAAQGILPEGIKLPPFMFPLLTAAFIGLCFLIPRAKKEKSSSIPGALGV